MSNARLAPKAAIASWIAQLTASAILGQTLFFKFSAAPESVAIFEALGAEPWGRLATGALEACTVVLLLVPRSAALGGLLGFLLMVGAIGAHLTKLGIDVQGDGGTLFAMAVAALVASAAVLVLRRRSLPLVGRAREAPTG